MSDAPGTTLTSLPSRVMTWLFGDGSRTFPGPSYEEWQPQSQTPGQFEEGAAILPGPRSEAPDTDEFRLRLSRMRRRQLEEQAQADAYMQQMIKNGMGPVPNPEQGTNL